MSRRHSSLSLPILRTSRRQHRAGTLTLGNMLSALGERSFGWAIVLFSLATLLPMPPGSSLLTALPLLVTTGQMIVGYSHVKVPGPLARLRLDPVSLRRTVLRLRPVTRRLEQVLTPRYPSLFSRRNERLMGLFSFLTAFALFLPVPLSGWFPAISLFIFGVGLIERDGLVATAGLILGGASVFLTAILLVTLTAGAEAIID